MGNLCSTKSEVKVPKSLPVDPIAEDPPYSGAGRRKSVFAEAYNPEEDESEEKNVSQNNHSVFLWLRHVPIFESKTYIHQKLKIRYNILLQNILFLFESRERIAQKLTHWTVLFSKCIIKLRYSKWIDVSSETILYLCFSSIGKRIS